jgi:uncharacterized membrane protein
MRTPASIAGHPLHPMLIVFPVGLFIFSFASDVISLRAPNPETWAAVAFYTMAGGFLGALAAAIPGLIDLLSLSDARVKKIALTHMSLNLLVVGLYAVNLWLRFTDAGNRGVPFWLSAGAVVILAASAWLGAEMVHKHGVGVDIQENSARTSEGAGRAASVATGTPSASRK